MLASQLPEILTRCLSDAQSNSDELQHKSLLTLSSITKVDPLNRSHLAQIDGAISTLLSLSKSPSPFVQTASLSILFNLSLNPDLKLPLSQMETIHHLNTIIQSPISLKSIKLASSLVCSLAMLDKNKAKFGVAGTVETLVKTVSEAQTPGPETHHLLSSLAELVQFHGNCTLAVWSGAVPVLIKLVKNTGGEDLAGTSLAVLCLLARFDEGLNALRKTEEIVRLMLEVLKGRSMLSKEGASEILVRLFDECEECVRDAMRLPEFTSALADLSVRGSARARETAGLLLKKLTEGNLDSYADVNPLFLEW